MHNQNPANHLAEETSPYLLQHVHNPVDWHPWGEAALALARREDKPILLSIGYSACHWCHVMAHESFEDAATAETINTLFVNIKVDREERPDLDKVYQLAHQLMARRSGSWPLTVFLNPTDLVPIFTGTYFPKESRYNLPGFVAVAKKVSDFYRENKDRLAQGQTPLINALNSPAASMGGSSLLEAGLLSKACLDIEHGFDPRWGGFGSAPKFPHVSTLDFLLRRQARHGDASALHMSIFSLRKMAEGGIYDQLGGGFCRYSVDAEWNIPHFEKMLYDNGPLLELYSHAWQVTGDSLFHKIAIETAEWVLREMRSPEGAFYSSLDADSEGEEGRFYVWGRKEVKSLLTEPELALLGQHYGLQDTPNFEGYWHLFVALPLDESATRLGMETEAAAGLLESARGKLFAHRELRVRPGRDEKILTAWNALMIKGMAIAGRVLGREDFLEAASKAIDFLHKANWVEGRLLASWKDGRARFPAYLDDYAFLLDAALELLQSRWDTSILHFAIALAETLLEYFEDQAGGGFYFTAHDHETLIHRPKSMTDESMPAGNGMAAFALNRLGLLLGEQRYIQAAERTLKAATPGMNEYPQGYGSLLKALDEWFEPPQTIVLRGDGEVVAAWARLAGENFSPSRQCYAIPATESDLPGLLKERVAKTGTVAYVCAATSCLPPVQDLEEFQQLLNAY